MKFNKKIKNLFYTLLAFLTLNVPLMLYAGEATGPQPGGGGVTRLQNPISSNNLKEFITSALEVVRDLGIIVAVFFIIFAGFLLVTAQGDKEKLTKGRNALLWAIVGTAVVLGAQLFASVIDSTISEL